MARSYVTKGAVGHKQLTIGSVTAFIGMVLIKLEILVLLGLLLIIIGAILTITAIIKNRKSVKEITNNVVRPFLERNFPGAVYDPFCEETDMDIYTDLNVIRRDSRMSYADYLSLTLDGNYFECVHCEASHSTENSTVVTFDGNIYSCMGDRNIEGTVRIIPTNQGSIIKSNEYHTYAKCAKDEVHIETGDESFDCCFEVYASDMHVGHYVMNAYVKEKLVALREKYGDYCIVVTGHDIYLAHKTSELLFLANISDVTIGDDVKVENIQESIKDVMNDMLELQRTMSLHTEV